MKRANMKSGTKRYPNENMKRYPNVSISPKSGTKRFGYHPNEQ